MDYGFIECDTRTQKFTILNQKNQVVNDSENNWRHEDFVSYDSFFTGDEYKKLKILLEKMSDKFIEITPENIA